MEDEHLLTVPGEDYLLLVSGVPTMNRKPTVAETRIALGSFAAEGSALSRSIPQTDNTNHYSTRGPR